MRTIVFLLVLLLGVSFCRDFNRTVMLALFPKHAFQKSDTLHFAPDDFDQRRWSTLNTTSMDRFLHNGNSCSPSSAAAEGYFYLPLMKIDLGGDTAYIVAEGDTNDIWIYAGKHTKIYMINKQTGRIEPRYELAWGGAGEGPWYETNSWILDLNNNGVPDILTRETGEWLAPDSTGELIDHQLDELSAVTWNDTGFVNVPLRNPDSLKQVYRVYHKSN